MTTEHEDQQAPGKLTTGHGRKSRPVAEGDGKTLIGGLTSTELRVRAKEARSERLARAKEILPERKFQWLERVPAKYRDRAVRSVLGEASPRVAIRAYCEGCVGYEDVLPRVGDCRARDCRVWTLRPYQEQRGKHPITSAETYHD